MHTFIHVQNGTRFLGIPHVREYHFMYAYASHKFVAFVYRQLIGKHVLNGLSCVQMRTLIWNNCLSSVWSTWSCLVSLRIIWFWQVNFWPYHVHNTCSYLVVLRKYTKSHIVYFRVQGYKYCGLQLGFYKQQNSAVQTALLTPFPTLPNTGRWLPHYQNTLFARKFLYERPFKRPDWPCRLIAPVVWRTLSLQCLQNGSRFTIYSR